MRGGDLHTLAGPYALDALPARDRQRFERHLARCDVCREEARGLSEAAARMAAVTATVPPPGMRDRVLAGVAATRQLPPGAPAGLPAAGPADMAREAALRPVGVPRLAVAAAGLVALAGLAVGSFVIRTQHRIRQEQTQIAAIMTAPDASMMTASAAGDGRATVVMSHRARALVLTTARLPALPRDRAYELWLLGPHGARASGMLPAPRKGMTAPVVVSGLAAKDRIELTVEPESGASHPDSRPVLMLTLP